MNAWTISFCTDSQSCLKRRKLLLKLILAIRTLLQPGVDWLEFNNRVLHEARPSAHPVRTPPALAIFSST